MGVHATIQNLITFIRVCCHLAFLFFSASEHHMAAMEVKHGLLECPPTRTDIHETTIERAFIRAKKLMSSIFHRRISGTEKDTDLFIVTRNDRE